jgi:hypothetical protein
VSYSPAPITVVSCVRQKKQRIFSWDDNSSSAHLQHRKKKIEVEVKKTKEREKKSPRKLFSPLPPTT